MNRSWGNCNTWLRVQIQFIHFIFNRLQWQLLIFELKWFQIKFKPMISVDFVKFLVKYTWNSMENHQNFHHAEFKTIQNDLKSERKIRLIP